MPIEIRELIIKTEVTVGNGRQGTALQERDMAELKRQLLEECKRLIVEGNKKQRIKR